MDFPKNHPLSPEEMVSTYEQTCATGLGIRACLEEANKKSMLFTGLLTFSARKQIYLEWCSYCQIRTLILRTKRDKYENGVITHRPPPLQPSRRPRLNRQCKVVEVD
ncbi:hypothetical protein HID58_056811 [Brassica napus]|uniref:Uncharacterized protein n=1 Tax=Brassica napus TaxID=3708 RepID=A0ABQ8AQ77_BRANA|nr:hypothetical protein HID58_056811 [Brassica napus]